MEIANYRSFGKAIAKDTIYILRQLTGLPHNKTRRQIRTIKATFDPLAIQGYRINLIATMSGLPEAAVREFDTEVHAVAPRFRDNGTYWLKRAVSISDRDGISLYALVLALKPEMCVETGAGGEASSAHILSALQRNGEGRLVSVDVESRHQASYGELIPQHLRAN